MKMIGAQAIVKCLEEQGVEVMFGFPGGVIIDLFDELEKSNITNVLVRHEQGAVHAAQGYARVSGKVGVCFATSGPGATNLMTGIADASIDSTPLVCITGQVPAHLLGTDAFQETDVLGISMPVTKWNFQVTRAEEIPEAQSPTPIQQQMPQANIVPAISADSAAETLTMALSQNAIQLVVSTETVISAGCAEITG